MAVNLWKSYLWTADQLPVSLLAQLVERCTEIAKVMGSIPVQASTFFSLYLQYCLSSLHQCQIRFQFFFLNRSSHIWFLYFYSQTKKDVNKPVKIELWQRHTDRPKEDLYYPHHCHYKHTSTIGAVRKWHQITRAFKMCSVIHLTFGDRGRIIGY